MRTTDFVKGRFRALRPKRDDSCATFTAWGARLRGGLLRLAAGFAMLAALLIALTGSSRPASASCFPIPPTVQVLANVVGLAAGGDVTLQLNSGSTLTIGNGAVLLSHQVVTCSAYSVTVAEQPSGQVCGVANGTGTALPPIVVAYVSCSTPPSIQSCNLTGCVSESQLAAAICNQVANQVVGYVCMVGKAPPVYGGLARTAADAPSVAMTPDSAIDVGSVSKMLTAVAVLHALGTHGLSLDDPVAPYLYNNWTQGPFVNQLTFRQLLRHQASWAGNCGVTFDYEDLKSLVAAGLTQAPSTTTPTYGNCNFSLFRELLFMLESPLRFYVPPDNQGNGMPRAGDSANFYVSYMNQVVFQPVGITSPVGGPVACAPPPSGPADTLMYSSTAANVHGTDYGNVTMYCGAYGWVLSARDIFMVTSAIINGNVLLTATQQYTMITDCLGWDCAVTTDCLYVCKNGALADSQGVGMLWTYAGLFNCNVPIVVLVNSPLPPNWLYAPYNIIDMVSSTYFANLTEPGGISVCF